MLLLVWEKLISLLPSKRLKETSYLVEDATETVDLRHDVHWFD